MKSVLLALVALLAFTSSINAEDKSQEQAVRRVLADFAEALNRGDATAFAALFTEDADFVVITGKYLKVAMRS
jgi:ketosteroid isomerase-like protein